MRDTRDSQLGAIISVKLLCVALQEKGSKMDTSITLNKCALLLAWGLSLKISTLIPAQGQRENKKQTLKDCDPFSMFGGRGS